MLILHSTVRSIILIGMVYCLAGNAHAEDSGAPAVRLDTETSLYFQELLDKQLTAPKAAPRQNKPALTVSPFENKPPPRPADLLHKPRQNKTVKNSAKSAARPTLIELADEAARTNGVDPELFRALVHHESRWQIKAVSERGAAGLAQITVNTASECGLSDHERFDPEKNLACGAWYLALQKKRFGSYELALAAYNSGPGAVAKNGRVPDVAETRQFVKKIMRHWRCQTGKNKPHDACGTDN